ncbi:hypothetical protein L7F22_025589 [Adiantum nelumboides]|nr:hypothetical protein [Adiantum nelumboides]
MSIATISSSPAQNLCVYSARSQYGNLSRSSNSCKNYERLRRLAKSWVEGEDVSFRKAVDSNVYEMLHRGTRPGMRFFNCRAELEWLDHLVLAVGVGLPCTVMECGDVVHRSTLPRSNALNITPPGVLLTFFVASYLWARPGVAPGFWDMFLLAPLEQFIRPTYKKEDFVLGRKLGEGAFGTVYKASLTKKRQAKVGDLVVKKANEYGAVEVWMNERVRRACPKACADYVYGFLEKSSKSKGEEYWLVWRYEGDATLSDLTASKDFPYNVSLHYGTLDSGLIGSKFA